mmetsp:Transcript_6175/g.16164  ORF Transcript_6175/g.16164 Transcript_6175/m.16164 type:complete len:230 (-) Transcript_6175:177-866(-)
MVGETLAAIRMQRLYRYARDLRRGFIERGSRRQWREQERLRLAQQPISSRGHSLGGDAAGAGFGGGRDRSRTRAEMDVIQALRSRETGDEDYCDGRCFERIGRGSVRGLGTLLYVLSVGMLCRKYGDHEEFEESIERVLGNLRDHEATYEVGKSFKEVFAQRNKQRKLEKRHAKNWEQQLVAWRKRARARAQQEYDDEELGEFEEDGHGYGGHVPSTTSRRHGGVSEMM